MKAIKIKGWIARDIRGTKTYFGKPKMVLGRYEYSGNVRRLKNYCIYTESLVGGECKKVEIIIREVK